MFVDGGVKSASRYPYQAKHGWWVVHEDSPQYRAWEWWLREAIGKRVFPKPTMQVLFEWPPSTDEAADQVAQAISDTRDGDDPHAPKHRDGTRPSIGGARVPRHPVLWTGIVPEPKEEGKYPRDLKPWRDVLRENGRKIPRADSAMARALDHVQTGKSAPVPKSNGRIKTPLDALPLSDALRAKAGVKTPEPEPVF